jgi:uncharacterized coiled-coil DUF342 family protein
MIDREMLEAIGQVMDQKLQPINARLDRLEQDVSGIKEDVITIKQDIVEMREDIEIIKEFTEETRGVANFLLDWATITDPMIHERVKEHHAVLESLE